MEREKLVERRNYLIARFEEEISKIASLNKFGRWYLINANPHFPKNVKSIIFLIPYCLKNVDCKFRTEKNCDFNADPSLCSHCAVKMLVDSIKDSLPHEVRYYTIIEDSKDIPAAIADYTKKYGKFDAVIAVSCPTGMFENTEHIQKFPTIPVFFYMINGFEECDFKKASQGKFWGQTSLDIEDFKKAWLQCSNTSLNY